MHFSTAFFFSAFFMSTTNTVNIEKNKGNERKKDVCNPYRRIL